MMLTYRVSLPGFWFPRSPSRCWCLPAGNASHESDERFLSLWLRAGIPYYAGIHVVSKYTTCFSDVRPRPLAARSCRWVGKPLRPLGCTRDTCENACL